MQCPICFILDSFLHSTDGRYRLIFLDTLSRISGLVGQLARSLDSAAVDQARHIGTGQTKQIVATL